MDLEKDTVGYGIESGSGLGNPETLTVQLQLEAEKCPTAIQWLKDLLFGSIFDLTVCHPTTFTTHDGILAMFANHYNYQRIKAITEWFLADILEEKRNGNDVSSSLYFFKNGSQIIRYRWLTPLQWLSTPRQRLSAELAVLWPEYSI